MNDEDAIKVHVVNTDDINIVRTEEKEPQHFVLSTVVVAYGVAGYNNYEAVLTEDPLRKDWSILAVDTPIVLCSKSQLTDPANQVSGIPYPQGGYLPAGSSITGTGTAQLFAVATSDVPCRVSIFVNRRNALWGSAGRAGDLTASP
jgi:hypothetical protein